VLLIVFVLKLILILINLRVKFVHLLNWRPPNIFFLTEVVDLSRDSNKQKSGSFNDFHGGASIYYSM
jgi:hypothetical protein